MTKKNTVTVLKWRLSERPSVDAIEKLLGAGIITKEEARQIILDESEVEPKTVEDLQHELRLLRELVLSLAARQPETVIKIIEREIEKPYVKPYWSNPYMVWCSSTTANTVSDYTLAETTTTNLISN